MKFKCMCSLTGKRRRYLKIDTKHWTYWIRFFHIEKKIRATPAR